MIDAELAAGRVDPRVGSGRVGSRVKGIFPAFFV